VVLRIAAEHGVDLEQVEGTGLNGRVRKQDVLAYIERGGAKEEPPMHIESPYRPDVPAPPKVR
jgi:pyruvate/2-oxoglutarate dehydrogenase complex dihydrolipoamide acyltransferase (E2) component